MSVLGNVIAIIILWDTTNELLAKFITIFIIAVICYCDSWTYH